MIDTRVLPPDRSALADAARLLSQGGLVGLPTETVYGLAGDATNPDAVASIYAAKGRASFNPLIAHCHSFEAAAAEGAFEPLAQHLAQQFWPGPLTLVVPRQSHGQVCDLACAGLSTTALRVPAHPVMQAVLRLVGRPLAAPSANRSGRPTPTLASHVVDDLAGRIGLVIDAGASEVGLESTVVAVERDQATLLRVGAIPADVLERAIGAPMMRPGAEALAAPASPGMVLRHYAPDAPLRLNALSALPGEVWIGFGAIGADRAFNLSPSGSVVEAAARLFAALRAADRLAPSCIAVAPIPNEGIGEAINERLVRAADATGT